MNNKLYHGNLIRKVPLNGGNFRNILHDNSEIYYEAIIVQQDHLKMMHIQVTNTRYDKPEEFVRTFNIDWLTKEKDQEWLAWLIGDTIAQTIHQSNKNTNGEIRKGINSVLHAVGSKVKLGI